MKKAPPTLSINQSTRRRWRGDSEACREFHANRRCLAATKVSAWAVYEPNWWNEVLL